MNRVLLTLALASCFGVAFAGQQDATYITFSGQGADATTEGIYVPQDYTNPGVLIHNGTVARFVCVELVQTREGFTTMYARATIQGGPRLTMKIVDIPEGSGSAVAGFAPDSLADHCGADRIAPTHPVTTLKL